MAAIAELPLAERAALCDFIGERAETVLASAALLSGHGRVWFQGDAQNPAAVLVESALVPGEPQGFGDDEPLLELLSFADAWTCVEVDSTVADRVSTEFDRRWGLAQTVIDVVHELRTAARTSTHPLVRCLTGAEAEKLEAVSQDVLPDRALAVAAAELGRVFAAVDGNQIVGHGSSMAASRSFADIGVHVTEAFREQGIATAAASLACRAVQDAGLTPVWGAGSENAASLRVAEKIGFREVARLVFLVRVT
jgi:GNAT superfamily N-acetyltransferase